MLIASPSPFLLFPAAPPDSSSNYIRQLETKVRILEDDNNKLLSQVRHSRRRRAARMSSAPSPPAQLFPRSPETRDRQLRRDKVVARRLYEARPLTTVCPFAGERVYPCIIHGESVSLGSGRRC